MNEVVSTTVNGDAEHYQLSFTGKAGEYFGIWIVNLLLSIVTLGIYTAWAKVRRLRYFYGNTWLDGHNFEYHAKPTQILIGRIIVVAILLVMNLLAELAPIAGLAVVAVYLFGLPWLINKALSFNARMTSYRNVHFSFQGSYGKALWVFIVLPLATLLFILAPPAIVAISTGALDGGLVGIYGNLTSIIVVSLIGVAMALLMIPYTSKKGNEYIANGMRFGTAGFSAELAYKALLANLGVTLFAVLVPLLVLAGMTAWIFSSFTSDALEQPVQLVVVLGYLVIIAGFVFYGSGVRNIAFTNTTIEGGHSLASAVPRLGYVWVVVSNFFVSIITVGLMIPWAAIRRWNYLANHTAVESETGLDTFIEGQQPDGNVAAAEYLDIDGIDFGL